MPAVTGAKDFCYARHLVFDFIPGFAMHHGKKIVGPQGEVTGAAITMGDKIKCTNDFSHLADIFIRDVPAGHAIGFPAQGVMIGHRAHAADDTACQHLLHAPDHFTFAEPELIGNLRIGGRGEGQACLCRFNNGAVGFIQHAQSSTFRPMKNSSSLGML